MGSTFCYLFVLPLFFTSHLMPNKRSCFNFIRIFCVAFAALLISTFTLNAHASSIKQLDVSELITQSELVFEGQVVDSEARWNNNKTIIKTFITFQVNDVLHGTYSQSSLQLSFIGGDIDGKRIAAQGLRHLKLGEQGIFFVSSLTRNLANPIAGWSQGQFLFSKDSTGQNIVTTDSHHPVIGLNKRQAQDTRKSSGVLSEGVASDVMLSADPKSLNSGMKASDFKKELKARMRNLNQ